MGIVQAKNLTFEYIRRDEEGNVEGITTAVDNVNIDIKAGDFVAVLGHNGSGKSTFAKHLNALVMPTEGTVYVDGMDTKDADNILKVRQTAGMVFQNPDNFSMVHSPPLPGNYRYVSSTCIGSYLYITRCNYCIFLS